jgi:hypothetical protein
MGVTDLWDDRAVAAEEVMEDFAALHDCDVPWVPVEDKNEISGGLGTPAASNEVDGDLLPSRELLVQGPLKGVDDGGCVVGSGRYLA